MKKNIDLLQTAIIVLMALLAAFTGITAAYDKTLFWLELPFAAAALVFGIIRLVTARRDSRKFLEYIAGRLGAVRGSGLVNFPMAVAVIDESGCFVWNNALFHEEVVHNDEVLGLSAGAVFEGFDMEKALSPEGSAVKYKAAAIPCARCDPMTERRSAFAPFILWTAPRKSALPHCIMKPAPWL